MNLDLPFVPPDNPSGSADSVAAPALGGTSMKDYKVRFGKKHRQGYPPGAEGTDTERFGLRKIITEQ